MIKHIGADLHSAVVATAPGEERVMGRRRPVRNRTQPQFLFFVSLFLCRKLRLFLGKSTKTAATRAALLTPICTKSFVGWGFTPDPTGELTALPQTS